MEVHEVLETIWRSPNKAEEILARIAAKNQQSTSLKECLKRNLYEPKKNFI
jgi:hypothetical protein